MTPWYETILRLWQLSRISRTQRDNKEVAYPSKVFNRLCIFESFILLCLIYAFCIIIMLSVAAQLRIHTVPHASHYAPRVIHPSFQKGYPFCRVVILASPRNDLSNIAISNVLTFISAPNLTVKLVKFWELPCRRFMYMYVCGILFQTKIFWGQGISVHLLYIRFQNITLISDPSC